VTGVLQQTGNGNADRVVRIKTYTGNSFFDKSGQYDLMVVLARPGNVTTVVQEMTTLYGRTSFGIVSPAAIMQAQQHTQAGSASFTLEIGYIALLASGIGVVTTLWTSVNDRTKEIGTLKAIGAKPSFILSMFLSDAVIIGLIGSILGIVAGIGLAYTLSTADGSSSHITPVFLSTDLTRVWILTIIISTTAGIFPAWKASLLSPLEALRKI